jgi:hypothetical protein
MAAVPASDALILSLFVTDVSGLPLLEDPWLDDGRPVSVYANWLRRARDVMRTSMPALAVKRLYFGQEYCQRLLPEKADLSSAIAAAQSAGIDFTLVTPYVSDDGLVRLGGLLEVLASEWPGSEVVANDWGALMLLKEQFPILVPVAGRLLEKMKRDPRFSSYDYQQFFGEHGLALLRDSNASALPYQRFLQRYGVARVEFDNVPQGIDVDMSGTPLRGSVYAPFGFVTTGRICFIGALNAPPERRFRVDTPCRHECRSYEHFLRRNVSPMPGAATSPSVQQVELARKGNTIFFANPDVSWVSPRRGFDRVVFTPRLPL